MNHFFITGTSRGIGEAIANQLLSPKNSLFCLSRERNQTLEAAAQAENCSLTYHQVDLSRPFDILEIVPLWLNSINQAEAESICMIHNAGLLGPIGGVGGEDRIEAIVANHHVNFMSPVILTERFVEWVQDWPLSKQVLMISSGAARNPKAAWSAYCSSKAALEMFARTLAVEQEEKDHPIRVVSLAPGVVDTAMQGEIREQSEENMPGVQRFIDFKVNNQLFAPDFVAQRIQQLLESKMFGEQVVMDLRE